MKVTFSNNALYTNIAQSQEYQQANGFAKSTGLYKIPVSARKDYYNLQNQNNFQRIKNGLLASMSAYILSFIVLYLKHKPLKQSALSALGFGLAAYIPADLITSIRQSKKFIDNIKATDLQTNHSK